MRYAALLLIASALCGSCGKEEVPEVVEQPEVAEERQEPEVLPQPVPEPEPEPVHPFAAYADARVMPHFEPRLPTRHFFATGKVTFHLPDRAITQNAELRLADADRMMYRIREGEEHPNVFLLRDAERCWLMSGGEEYRPYDSLDLWIETTLRWHVLRFPWGWEDAIATPLGDQTDGDSLAQDFLLETRLGELHLETDANGFPVVASLRAKHVRLDDWHMATPSGNLIPLSWDWTSEQGRRTEQFDVFRDQVLVVDNAFAPEGTAPNVTRLMIDDADIVAGGENLVEMERSLQSFGPDATEAQQALGPGAWWTVEGNRRYLFQEDVPPIEDPNIQVIPRQTWLTLATSRPLTPEQAKTYLREALLHLDLIEDGPIWSRIDPDHPHRRRGFLMPVKPAKP